MSPNRYATYCCDCSKDVAAGEGFLYRYSGANKRNRPSNCQGHKRINEFSTMYFAIRCTGCAKKRGDRVPKTARPEVCTEGRLRLMEAGAAEVR